uniref:WW domain-containing protein n=1 Tax=Haptolina ericina TaxID=156174 RepID=A0A7S3FJ80_9EUKA
MGNGPDGQCPTPGGQSRTCLILAIVQGVLTLLGLGFSLLPWLGDASLCRQQPGLCLNDLHRHSWWLTPPTNFWAGVAAVCMLRGSLECKTWCRSWWLSTAFDLQVLVAPVSLACFALLGWQAISAGALHSAACARLAVTATASSGFDADAVAISSDGDAAADASHCAYPSRAVFTYAFLSIVMQIHAACAVCAAFVVRAQQQKAEAAASTSKGKGEPRSGERVRGWRKRINAEGRTFYEHRRTGRVEWEPPLSSSDVEEGRSDSGFESCLSGSEGRLPRVDEG